MILIHLLLFLVVLIALVLQLITPVVLNIPLIAFCLVVLIFTIWSFRRARKHKKVPIVASLALGLQSLLFILSIAILAIVTIPHESAEDSPAVVQGIRRFLISQGIIDKPKNTAPPIVSSSQEKKPAETVNAPDAAKIEIKIEDDTRAKPVVAKEGDASRGSGPATSKDGQGAGDASRGSGPATSKDGQGAGDAKVAAEAKKP